jgi:hypothetical protein
MDAIVARVVEALVADVVTAVREHESYKQLVATLANKAIASAASSGAQVPVDASAPAGAGSA